MTRPPVDVGLLGASGIVGQQIATLLDRHPWFRLAWVAASEGRAGMRLGDATWRLPEPPGGAVRALRLDRPAPGAAPALVFSALPAGVAGPIEAAFAAAGHVVVSNARDHRLDPLVPLIVPEVNADHSDVLGAQRVARGWSGALVTNPNCAAVAVTLALAPLRPLGLRRVLITTLQAISGAGYPGVASFDALGNVVPHIAGEEQKIEMETPKILGACGGKGIAAHPVVVSATATRVPVLHGHTAIVSVELEQAVEPARIRAAWDAFRAPAHVAALPSAPDRPVVYLEEEDRPQPRRDAERSGGMVVWVGRLRHCPILGFKFVALGHNTLRGAAGAAVLNAELVVARLGAAAAIGSV